MCIFIISLGITSVCHTTVYNLYVFLYISQYIIDFNAFYPSMETHEHLIAFFFITETYVSRIPNNSFLISYTIPYFCLQYIKHGIVLSIMLLVPKRHDNND